MNKLTNSMNKSIVKLVINVLLGGLVCVPGFAETKDSGGPFPYYGKSTEQIKAETDSELQNTCREYRNKITDAKKAIAEACKKGGMGPNCSNQVSACSAALGSEIFTSVVQVAQAAGVPINKKNPGCPQMGAAKFDEQKKQIEDRIREIKDESEKLPDTRADLMKEYNDKLQEMTDAQNQANDDLQKVKSELNDAEIEQVQKFQESQRAAQKALRDSQSKLLELKASMSTLVTDKATRMLQFTGGLQKYTCLGQYRKAIDEYKKTNDASNQSNSGHIKTAKLLKQVGLDAYDKCWESFNQERIKINQEMQIKQDLTNDKIASTEADIDAQNDAISSAQVSFEEIKKSKDDKMAAAQKKVNDLIALNNQKAMAAQADLQDRINALTAKQLRLDQDLTAANNSLLNLGPQPDPDAETSPKLAQPELAVQQEIIDDILSDVKSNPQLRKACPSLLQSANGGIKSKFNSGKR